LIPVSEDTPPPGPAASRQKPESPNTNKRTPGHKAADMLFIEKQHLRGKGVREIAEMLSKERPYTLSHSQVALDLKKLRELWRKEAIGLVSEERQRALRKFDILESECWEAWDKSKQAKTRTTLTKKSKGAKGDAPAAGPGEDIKSAVSMSSPGDPAFVGKILEIHDRRARLLGLDAPSKHEHGGPDGGPIPIANANVPLNEADQQAILRRHFLRMQEDGELPTDDDASPDGDAQASDAPDAA
jgi:hypothetical protein